MFCFFCDCGFCLIANCKVTKLKVHIKSLKVAKFVFNFNACMLHAFIWLARADQGWRRSCRKRTQPCSQHTGEQHSHGAQAVASRERIHRWNLYWPISKPEAISWKIPTTTRMLLSGKTSFKVVILLLGFKLGVWCMDVWRTVMFFFCQGSQYQIILGLMGSVTSNCFGKSD